jgi:hypothetical protein
MSLLYWVGGVLRARLDNAPNMRDNVIEMQQRFAEMPPTIQKIPDVADAINKAHALRGALEKLL